MFPSLGEVAAVFFIEFMSLDETAPVNIEADARHHLLRQGSGFKMSAAE
jgi:hypothetical protein